MNTEWESKETRRRKMASESDEHATNKRIKRDGDDLGDTDNTTDASAVAIEHKSEAVRDDSGDVERSSDSRDGSLDRPQDVKEASRVTSTTTTTTPTNDHTAPSCPAELLTTVYCDLCSKARHVKPEFAHTINPDLPWHCSSISAEACDRTDDEIVDIAGEMFGKVLDSLGIKTRRDLAKSYPDEYESGPFQTYVDQFISDARTAEIRDALIEIVGDDEIVVALEELGIYGPYELAIADDEILEQVLSNSKPEQDTQNTWTAWRSKATKLLDENAWMCSETD